MTRMIGPGFQGTAITNGLLPSLGTLPPQGGIPAMALVKHIPMHPASAACQPYVPPRIQWFELPSTTQLIPPALARWMARSIQIVALYMPGPRWPSHCSRLPVVARRSGSACGSTNPSFTRFTKTGNRLSPWEYTPSRLLLAKIAAQMAALVFGKDSCNKTRSSSFFSWLKDTVIGNLLTHDFSS